MLEAAVQASAWLVREWSGFRPSLVILKEARGIRYGSFVEPGRTLIMRSEVVSLDMNQSEFKIRGSVGNDVAITGRIELAHLKLGHLESSLENLDNSVNEAMARQWRQLRRSNDPTV